MKLQTCPDPQQLRHLVNGDLNEHAEAALEEHLSSCELCRAQVEQRIQSSDWWKQARTSLKSSPSEASADEADSNCFDVLSLLGPTDDPDKLGRIAEYEVVGIIGRGGMGVVFKAFDPRLNRFVAIKMLLPHLAVSGAARKRFAREGQAAAAVVDDYVLPIHAVAEWRGVPYLVTQYSRGTTLQKRVRNQGPLELKEILRIGMQTARGLAAAHAQGLVHRDVKPSNILLDGSVERAMLTDFGLARAVDDASITRTGIIAGTPQYMSPEQARGGSVDARSDLFSLGCVQYFLCTGRPPFRADNSYAILRLITDEEPRAIREINPEIPEWLCAVVQKLMAKKADDRYDSAMEVAELLETCLAHVQQPTVVVLPGSLVATTNPHLAFLNPRRKGLFTMVALLVMALSGVMFWQSSEPPDISGTWTSDEWGTVEMQSKSPGNYEGTMKNAVHTMGANPHTGATLNGDFLNLRDVALKGVQCNKCHEGKSGTLELKWSRLARRFNGTWTQTDDQQADQRMAGKLSVRFDDEEIHGAWTTRKKSDPEPGTPRLADLVWTRSTGKPDFDDSDTEFQSMLESMPVFPLVEGQCKSTSPPDQNEILRILEEQKGLNPRTITQLYQTHEKSFRIIVEPIYDKVVAIREYPLVGRASLHLLRYRCTVQFKETEGVEWPITENGVPKTEVTFYADWNHLHHEDDRKQNAASTNRDTDAAPTWPQPLETDDKQLSTLFRIGGLVESPGIYSINGDEVRLFDAIALAGGVSSQASDKVIVIRSFAGQTSPTTIELSIRKAKESADDNIVIQPGDVISIESAFEPNPDDARSTIETFVAALLAEDSASASQLASEIPGAQIQDLSDSLNVKRLGITSVHVNDRVTPTKALATTEAVRLEGQRYSMHRGDVGILVFEMKKKDDEGWSVTDIDFAAADGARKELSQFIEANPTGLSLPAETTPSERLAQIDGEAAFYNLPEDTTVHIVGCYSTEENKPVKVHIRSTGKPMIVVLNAYFSVNWDFDIAADADVRGVILSGYFDQRFSHQPPENIPVVVRTYFPVWKGITQEEKDERLSNCFYVWSSLLEDFGKMTSLINDMTHRPPTTFQGAYFGTVFTVDGKIGAEEFKLANRWQELTSRADITSLEYLRAKAELESIKNNSDPQPSDWLKQMSARMNEFQETLPKRP